MGMGLGVVITGFSTIERNGDRLLFPIGEEHTVDAVPMNGNQTCRGFHDGPIVQIPKALHLEQVGIEKCRYFGLPDIKGARESGK
tara:strand:+ start:14636 stop:14890 length:255 start_codon:yes stop_codon:yes gene_type:complete